jgi:putative methanogen marker protein 4
MESIIKEPNDQIHFLSTSNPCQDIIQLLSTPQEILSKTTVSNSPIDGIIRGGLNSADFLKTLRDARKKLSPTTTDEEFPTLTYRLALLETAQNYQFFFSPVGIDEANNFVDKKKIIQQSIQFLEKMQIIPKIAILSGGRLSDIGRDPWIDQNIEAAENLTRYFEQKTPQYHIKHYQILIENAIQDQVNFILAPEGIAGNLIYRTLVHLGNGRSYGAIYLTHYNLLHKIIIDTSRVAPEFEIEGSLYFAIGLPLM